MNQYLPCQLIKTTNRLLSEIQSNVFPTLLVVNWFNNEHLSLKDVPARAWKVKPSSHDTICKLLYDDLCNLLILRVDELQEQEAKDEVIS